MAQALDRRSTDAGTVDDDDVPIRHTPGVMGGAACVRRTRIGVWLLVQFAEDGLSDADLLDSYPGLTQADLEAAWAYYRDHTDEIDAEIRRQEDA